jgi:hypothetical protein
MTAIARAALLTTVSLVGAFGVLAAHAADPMPAAPTPSASPSDPLKGWGLEDQPKQPLPPTPLPTPTPLARQGVGLVAGSTSGVGFAWRNVGASGWGWQVGGGAWVPTFDPPSGSWSIGSQALKILAQQGEWRLYALAGLQSYGYPGAWNTDGTSRSYESILNVGGGLGLEIGYSKGMSFCLEVPLVLGYRVGNTPGFSHLIPIPNVLLLVNF